MLNKKTDPLHIILIGISLVGVCFVLIALMLSGNDAAREKASYDIKGLPRAITIRLGVDINIGEDKPAQLSVDQDRVTNVDDCPEIGVYPKRPKGEKCITILHQDGERYPINYVGGGVDIWTVNQNPEGKYTITRLNGKVVDLGLANE